MNDSPSRSLKDSIGNFFLKYPVANIQLKPITLRYNPGAHGKLKYFSINTSNTGVELLNIVTLKLNDSETPEYLTPKGKEPTNIEKIEADINAVITEKRAIPPITEIKLLNDKQ